MTALIWETGMSSATAIPPDVEAGTSVEVGWAAADPEPAPSTSFLTIRPLGPEPVNLDRSTPCCSAIFRASGDAFDSTGRLLFFCRSSFGF